MKTEELAAVIDALSLEEKKQVNAVLKNTQLVTCPQGYIWNGTQCVPDVGKD